MKEEHKVKLSTAQQEFVLHWGEMGARWGINRTVAQLHALLYLSPRPLHAEEITETLSVARSHISNSLRELLNWGLIKVVHVLGDRRDHFESLKDVWQMFQIVIEGRKRREIDPTVALLREAVAELKRGGPKDSYTEERLRAMLDFFETATEWYEKMSKLPLGALRKLSKWSGDVRKLFGIKIG